MKKAHKKMKKKTGLPKWVRTRPFAVLAFCLAIMTLVLAVQLPRRMRSLERQGEQLTATMNTYSGLQAERNVLRSEAARVDDVDYIEKLARREHGYGWYGETIYEVGNLVEIQAAENGGN